MFVATGGKRAIAILPYLEQQGLYDRYDQSVYNSHPNNLPVLQTPLSVMICPVDPNDGKLIVPTQGSYPEPGIATGSYKAVSGRRWGATNGYFDYPPFHQSAGRTADTRGPMYMIGMGRFSTVEWAFIDDGTSRTLMVGETMTVPTEQFRASNIAFWASTHSFHNLGCPQPESYTRHADYDACMTMTGNRHWLCDRTYGSLHSGGIMQFVLCDGSVLNISPKIDGDLFQNMATIAGREAVVRP